MIDLDSCGEEGIDCKGRKWEKDHTINHGKDLSGQRFSKLYVLFKVKEIESDSYCSKWLCKCDCGNEIIVNIKKLRNNSVQSCGCWYDDSIVKRRGADLTGERYGRLLVLGRDYGYIGENGVSSYKIYWRCKCDCGNLTTVSTSHLRRTEQPTRSCGCLSRDLASSRQLDLTGNRYGKLTVLEKDNNYKTKNGNVYGNYWRCICDCGNEISVSGNCLRAGGALSCGCSIREKSKAEMIGQKFGNLVVLSYTDKRQNGQIVWECKCDCGNIVYVPTTSLKNGNTQSCGCIKSIGEQKIISLLSENDIIFETQKVFDNCRFPDSGRAAKFDFYIENSFVLEYDGEQHFRPRSGWNTKDNYNNLVFRDMFKNKWCIDNNIPIKRIPYTDLNSFTLDDILSEKYLITEV